MSLLKLAKFIERYPNFNQRSLDNDIIGIGNRINDDFTELEPFVETVTDYFGEQRFADRYKISQRDAVYLCDAAYSRLQIGFKDPDRDTDKFVIVSKKLASKVLTKLAKNYD